MDNLRWCGECEMWWHLPCIREYYIWNPSKDTRSDDDKVMWQTLWYARKKRDLMPSEEEALWQMILTTPIQRGYYWTRYYKRSRKGEVDQKVLELTYPLTFEILIQRAHEWNTTQGTRPTDVYRFLVENIDPNGLLENFKDILVKTFLIVANATSGAFWPCPECGLAV